MAESEQKIIIILVIYFTILSLLFISVVNVVNDYGLNVDETISSTGGGTEIFMQDSFAADPRFLEEQQSLTKRIVGNRRTVSRDITPAPFIEAGVIYDDDSCEQFNDFNWVTKNRWVFWGETTETCTGFLNLTYYNDGNDFDVSSSWGGRYINKPVCELSSLQNNQLLGELFGCTWYTQDMIEDLELTKGTSTFINIWNTIKQIVSLRISFNTDYSLFNGLLALFLVWLPLITLILTVIMYVRKIIGFT